MCYILTMLLDTVKIIAKNSAAAQAEPLDGETLGEYCDRTSHGNKRAAINRLGALLSGGAIDVQFQPFSQDVATAVRGDADAKKLCAARPSLWNALCYEREWADYREYNDFLSPGSPVFHKKLFQWETYRRLLDSLLSPLKPGAKILDVGGGVGRAAVPLAREGFFPTIADASPMALKTAWTHLAGTGGSYDLAWTDILNLSMFDNGSFDCALALEAFCYHESPEACLAAAASKVKSGGFLAFSIENMPAAIFSDPSVNSGNIDETLKKKLLLVEDEVYVKYFDPAELLAMAKQAGLRDARVEGCHYAADNFLGFAVGEEAYGDPAKNARLRTVEEALKNMDSKAAPPRAWFVSGIVE